MSGFFYLENITKVNRLKLINCSPAILKWILDGDDILSQNLEVIVPENWSEFGFDAFKYSLNVLSETPESQKWLIYLPIDMKSNTIIGTCGYKGEPKNGSVEIGYEVVESFRNQGYATEMAKLLIEIAFKERRIDIIKAHTLTEENPSVKVLKKCGFFFVKEIFDAEDGKLWEWNLSR
jgi:RimJ/RimL family protein N-acetyltransferase